MNMNTFAFSSVPIHLGASIEGGRVRSIFVGLLDDLRAVHNDDLLAERKRNREDVAVLLAQTRQVSISLCVQFISMFIDEKFMH